MYILQTNWVSQVLEFLPAQHCFPGKCASSGFISEIIMQKFSFLSCVTNPTPSPSFFLPLCNEQHFIHISGLEYSWKWYNIHSTHLHPWGLWEEEVCSECSSSKQQAAIQIFFFLQNSDEHTLPLAVSEDIKPSFQ